MHIRLGVQRGGRDRKVHQLQAGQGALDQLANPLGRADFKQLRSLAQQNRVGERGTDAEDPSRTPQAAFALHVGQINVRLGPAELESDAVRWSHDFEVTPDQRIHIPEGGGKVAMPVLRNLVASRFE